VYKWWMAGASAHAAVRQRKIEYSYTPSTSVEGRQKLAMSLVHFVGSDVPPPPEYRRTMPGLWIVPSLGTAIAVVFNLPNYTGIDLKIPRAALADIFIGRIRKWSELAEWNERLTGVRENISLVVQADGAESYWLTSALSSFSTEWRGKVGISSKPAWQSIIGRNIRIARGAVGMASLVHTAPYTLGYMSHVSALSLRVQMALIQNAHGAWVAPGRRGVAAAMDAFVDMLDKKRVDNSDKASHDFTLSIIDPQTGLDAYPIAMLTYIMFDVASLSCKVLHDVLYLLYWIWSDAAAAQKAEESSLTPISPHMSRSLIRVLASIRCDESHVLSDVLWEVHSCETGAAIFVSRTVAAVRELHLSLALLQGIYCASWIP